MATPRKAATTGFDSGGNVTGAPKQMPQSAQDDNPSGQDESAYSRKAANIGPSNLPFKRQPETTQMKAGNGSR